MNGGSSTRAQVRLSGLPAILGAFALDQVTKLWALAILAPGEVYAVLPIFNLRLSFNKGISFSLFAETFADWPILLAGIILAITLFLGALLIRSATRWEAISFGLIIGGAVGNVLDRLRHGAVTDFLDFHLQGVHWPAFNLADLAIVIGVIGLIVASIADRHARGSAETTSS